MFRLQFDLWTWLILAVAVVALAFVANAGFTYFLIVHQQHQWCQVVDLLTRTKIPKPQNPAANPSRETAYEFYADFVQLRHSLGCG